MLQSFCIYPQEHATKGHHLLKRNIQTNKYISFVLMQKSWNKRISVLPPGQCACLYLDNVYMHEFVCINPCRNASKSPFYHD